MKTHVHDFFQIFSGGGHPKTAILKKPKICNLLVILDVFEFIRNK